ncbi:unnamed protein product [Caretta caretta]
MDVSTQLYIDYNHKKRQPLFDIGSVAAEIFGLGEEGDTGSTGLKREENNGGLAVSPPPETAPCSVPLDQGLH